MARSRETKRAFEPESKKAVIIQDPTKYYRERPSWKFSKRDRERWRLPTWDREDEWDRLLEHLDGWETQTWQQILVDAKKQNHSIEVNELNKAARDRLQELHIEEESVISLRLSGTQRIYGIMDEDAFCIIWFDDNHGDNDTCVCRSHKKHT